MLTSSVQVRMDLWPFWRSLWPHGTYVPVTWSGEMASGLHLFCFFVDLSQPASTRRFGALCLAQAHLCKRWFASLARRWLASSFIGCLGQASYTRFGVLCLAQALSCKRGFAFGSPGAGLLRCGCCLVQASHMHNQSSCFTRSMFCRQDACSSNCSQECHKTSVSHHAWPNGEDMRKLALHLL